MSDDASHLALVFRTAGRLCALPLAQVVETMRPQPVQRLDGTPAFVLGAVSFWAYINDRSGASAGTRGPLGMVDEGNAAAPNGTHGPARWRAPAARSP